MRIGDCKIHGCDNHSIIGRGWCKTHYYRWWRNGDPLICKYIRGDDLKRAMSKIEAGPAFGDLGECWLWTGAISQDGYAQLRIGTKIVIGHRWIYEQLVGPIPDETELDHLCRRRRCVRPLHLDPITHQRNVIRGHIARGTLRDETRRVLA